MSSRPGIACAWSVRSSHRWFHWATAAVRFAASRGAQQRIAIRSGPTSSVQHCSAVAVLEDQDGEEQQQAALAGDEEEEELPRSRRNSISPRWAQLRTTALQQRRARTRRVYLAQQLTLQHRMVAPAGAVYEPCMAPHLGAVPPLRHVWHHLLLLHPPSPTRRGTIQFQRLRSLPTHRLDPRQVLMAAASLALHAPAVPQALSLRSQ